VGGGRKESAERAVAVAVAVHGRVEGSLVRMATGWPASRASFSAVAVIPGAPPLVRRVVLSIRDHR
jgi:DNA-binding transcriptional regulator YdaS (Cro superfamily)